MVGSQFAPIRLQTQPKHSADRTIVFQLSDWQPSIRPVWIYCSFDGQAIAEQTVCFSLQRKWYNSPDTVSSIGQLLCVSDVSDSLRCCLKGPRCSLEVIMSSQCVMMGSLLSLLLYNLLSRALDVKGPIAISSFLLLILFAKHCYFV